MEWHARVLSVILKENQLHPLIFTLCRVSIERNLVNFILTKVKGQKLLVDFQTDIYIFISLQLLAYFLLHIIFFGAFCKFFFKALIFIELCGSGFYF